MLEQQRHAFITRIVETKYQSIDEIDDKLGLGSPEMPSLKSIMAKNSISKSTSTNVSAQVASSGIVRLNLAKPEMLVTHDESGKRFS